METKVCHLYTNRCYTTANIMTPKGIMVHSTGANNPYLRRYVQPSLYDDNYEMIIDDLGKNPYNNHWNRRDIDVCVHAFIGLNRWKEVECYETLPLYYRGWHAGSGPKGSANDGYISFEMCEDGLDDENYFKKVMDCAMQFCAELCKRFHLDPYGKNVIICHQDGYRLGIASNHGDIYNWLNKFGKSMEWFRNGVYKYYKEGEKQVVSDWAKDAMDWAVKNKISDGENPQDKCTREQVITMLYRAFIVSKPKEQVLSMLYQALNKKEEN